MTLWVKTTEVRLCLHRPFAVIDNVIETEHAVFLIVGLAQDAYSNFEERATGAGLTEAEPFIIGGEFFRRSGNRAAGTRDDIGALVDIVLHRRIGFRKPGTVVIMTGILQASDHPGPVKARSPIEAVDRIWEDESSPG